MRFRPTLPSDAEVQGRPCARMATARWIFCAATQAGAVEALGANEVEVGFVDRNNLHDGREVVELLANLERVAAG